MADVSPSDNLRSTSSFASLPMEITVGTPPALLMAVTPSSSWSPAVVPSEMNTKATSALRRIYKHNIKGTVQHFRKHSFVICSDSHITCMFQLWDYRTFLIFCETHSCILLMRVNNLASQFVRSQSQENPSNQALSYRVWGSLSCVGPVIISYWQVQDERTLSKGVFFN